MEVDLGTETASTAQLDAGGPSVLSHFVAALPEPDERAVDLFRREAEIEIVVVARLPAEDRVHGPTAVHHRIHAGAGQEVEQGEGLSCRHFGVEAQRRAAVEAPDAGRQPGVAAIR